jgi:tyrosine-protein phosphatase YwqE
MMKFQVIKIKPNIISIVFVAVDRTHQVRSVTHSHDASGARTPRVRELNETHRQPYYAKNGHIFIHISEEVLNNAIVGYC